MLIFTIEVFQILEHLDEMLWPSRLQVLISELFEQSVPLLELCILVLPLGVKSEYVLLVIHLQIWVFVPLLDLFQITDVTVPLALQEWILDKLVLHCVFEISFFILLDQRIEVFFKVFHPLLEVELPSWLESKLVAL